MLLRCFGTPHTAASRFTPIIAQPSRCDPFREAFYFSLFEDQKLVLQDVFVGVSVSPTPNAVFQSQRKGKRQRGERANQNGSLPRLKMIRTGKPFASTIYPVICRRWQKCPLFSLRQVQKLEANWRSSGKSGKNFPCFFNAWCLIWSFQS